MSRYLVAAGNSNAAASPTCALSACRTRAGPHGFKFLQLRPRPHTISHAARTSPARDRARLRHTSMRATIHMLQAPNTAPHWRLAYAIYFNIGTIARAAAFLPLATATPRPRRPPTPVICCMYAFGRWPCCTLHCTPCTRAHRPPPPRPRAARMGKACCAPDEPSPAAARRCLPARAFSGCQRCCQRLPACLCPCTSRPNRLCSGNRPETCRPRRAERNRPDASTRHRPAHEYAHQPANRPDPHPAL